MRQEAVAGPITRSKGGTGGNETTVRGMHWSRRKRGGRPPVSLSSGHWCGKDRRQGRSCGSARSPCIRPPAVWRD
ncbi:hypothetical protein E2C01_041083 [Portunus trituberculatus]|uniref:Uncharacterized protein n=1 Tax=Portunus trituberculatus TaxID=210409 RepID=A0A5B7FJ31_PORTR|nr:hypothetical protein [Portunus trituberculatus]